MDKSGVEDVSWRPWRSSCWKDRSTRRLDLATVMRQPKRWLRKSRLALAMVGVPLAARIQVGRRCWCVLYGTLHLMLRLKHPGFLALLAVHCAFAAAEMRKQGPINSGSCVLGQVGQRQKPFQGLTLETGQHFSPPSPQVHRLWALPFELTHLIFFWDPEVWFFQSHLTQVATTLICTPLCHSLRAIRIQLLEPIGVAKPVGWTWKSWNCPPEKKKWLWSSTDESDEHFGSWKLTPHEPLPSTQDVTVTSRASKVLGSLVFHRSTLASSAWPGSKENPKNQSISVLTV